MFNSHPLDDSQASQAHLFKEHKTVCSFGWLQQMTMALPALYFPHDRTNMFLLHYLKARNVTLRMTI